MTLSEMAAQYRQNEEILTRQIARLLRDEKTLSGEEKYRARSKLCLLYEMRRETAAAADEL